MHLQPETLQVAERRIADLLEKAPDADAVAKLVDALHSLDHLHHHVVVFAEERVRRTKGRAKPRRVA